MKRFITVLLILISAMSVSADKATEITLSITNVNDKNEVGTEPSDLR